MAHPVAGGSQFLRNTNISYHPPPPPVWQVYGRTTALGALLVPLR